MTTYSFPSIAPTTVVWELVSNTAIRRSPISAAIQTVDRGGEAWRVTMTFRNLRAADKNTLKAFVVKLNGHQHRFTVHDYGHTQRGNFGGSPQVAGAGQTGTTLTFDGASNNISSWIRAGDYFEVNGELKMATADESTDGGGAGALQFMPRLRAAPPDNTSIDVTQPTGIFMLESNQQGWSNMPGDLSDFTIVGLEDIVA